MSEAVMVDFLGKTHPRSSQSARRRNIKHPRYRFPGICRHAQELGVHRIHLYQVLAGLRVSHSLLRRYNALIAKERRA